MRGRGCNFTYNVRPIYGADRPKCLHHNWLVNKKRYGQFLVCHSAVPCALWSVLPRGKLRSVMAATVGVVISLRLRQNRRHFADDVFKCNFMNKIGWIPIEISLKFVPKGPINNIPALVQIMAWRRTGDKPLSEPMMTQLNDAYMRHSASMSYQKGCK